MCDTLLALLDLTDPTYVSGVDPSCARGAALVACSPGGCLMLVCHRPHRLLLPAHSRGRTKTSASRNLQEQEPGTQCALARPPSCARSGCALPSSSVLFHVPGNTSCGCNSNTKLPAAMQSLIGILDQRRGLPARPSPPTPPLGSMLVHMVPNTDKCFPNTAKCL